MDYVYLFEFVSLVFSAICPRMELLGPMVVLFEYFEKALYCFPQGCTSLHSHKQCRRVLFFPPHPCQHFLFVFSFSFFFFFLFSFCWVFALVNGLSLVAANEGTILCCHVWASCCSGFSCFEAPALGQSGTKAHRLQ